MKLRRLLKRLAVVVAVIVAIAAGGFWWTRARAATATEQPSLTFEAAKRGPIRQTVNSPGKVVSNLDVDIKCRASGEVIKLPFDISNKVKKGDLLLELDPVDQQRQVQQVEAALSASKARLEQAKSTLLVAQQSLEADRAKAIAAISSAEARAANASSIAKREQNLLEKKFSSTEEVETAQTTSVQAAQELKTAQAQIAALKAQELDLETKRQQINLCQAEVDSDAIALSVSKLQLGYTSVYAPMDGVVTAETIKIGTIISSGISNIGGGTTILTLSDLSHIYVLAAVDESDIGSVSLGQRVMVTADSFPGKRFEGKVDRIAAKGVTVSNVVTFEVRVEVLSENKTLLKPEMSANVTIIIADKPDALLVPAASVIREKGATYVAFKGSNDEAGDKQPVEIGISDGMKTEVISGVKEGDEVAVQNLELDSRWRAGGDQGPGGNSDSRRRMMMMRTLGGGGGGGRGR